MKESSRPPEPDSPRRNRGTDALPFGKILKSAMTARKLTVRQAARLAGVSTSVLQDWISGANPHDLHSVARLAEALQMPFQALLLGQAPSPGERPELTLEALYEEKPVFDGLCLVSIRKLKPRKARKEKSGPS